MKEKLVKYFEKNEKAMLDAIAELVSIPSVKDEEKDGMPFGENSYKALQCALKMADEMGLITCNHDGYVGSVDLNDKETELTILAHLDVVPAGEGWDSDPFTMIETDDKILGRGVSDDKGPAMTALFAMKAVKELGIELDKNCRLILGTNEECGSSDLKYYFSKNPQPKYAFTPDGNFPVVNGEKGRFSRWFEKTLDLSKETRRIVSINAGTTGNAVPSFANAVVEGFDENELKLAAEKSAYTNADFIFDGGNITCNGTSAHASLPENGNNPITALIDMLSNLDLDKGSKEYIDSLKVMFPHGKYNGEAFGVDYEDELGKLTLTLDILNFNGTESEGFFDTRTTLNCTEENCTMKIAKVLDSYGFSISNTKLRAPHYVDENSDFIKTLLSSYETYSGDKGTCICMGGGTYVHDIENGVAFGAIGRDVQTNMHGANEFMLKKDLLMSAEIFADVIIKMCCKK